MTTLLDIKDLHAGYGKAEVLRGLTLKADAGSVVTVIGPNGAGKSTLLNALMGVLPMRGSLRYAGEDVSQLSLEQRDVAHHALHRAGARKARAVLDDVGRRQPAAR